MKTEKNKYNENCWIIGRPKIGGGTWIGAFTVIDGSGGLTIGRRCEISSGTHIYTHSTHLRCVSEKSYKKDGTKNKAAMEKSPVRIGDYTFIGANTTILKGVTIGDHCVIGAGSVVTKDIPSYSMALGVPMRIVGRITVKDGRAKIRWSDNETKNKRKRISASL